MESWKTHVARTSARRRVLQWGHDDGVVEDDAAAQARRPRSSGFNGATTMESWKTLKAGPNDLLPTTEASMGPRRRSRGRRGEDELVQQRMTLQWGHDDGVVENWRAEIADRGRSSFNGATTKESWKTGSADTSVSADRWLQWGHDEGVVENGRRTADSVSGLALQWGHDEGVVENVLGSLKVRSNHQLQWGHDEGVVEYAEVVVQCSASCFNGATTKESWKTTAGRRAVVEPSSFNGATTREAWKGKSGNEETGCGYERCFNGTTTREAWKTGAAVPCIRRLTCFNGATTR